MTDPRLHPHVARADGDRITYCCGCVNEVHASGVLRSASKCRAHRAARREAEGLGLGYYQELGALKDGVPRCALLLGQLREAMGLFPRGEGGAALEVGCGASMYAPGLLRAGYDYTGLDPSPWACAWTASTFDVETVVGTLETADLEVGHFALVLAAHCLEHMDDAPGAIARCAGLLRPGGELWVVVPDDEDPVNPDHVHFFTAKTLRGCLEAAGLEVVGEATRRYVPQENFLYARGRKP